MLGPWRTERHLVPYGDLINIPLGIDELTE